jgi:uncharacterized protein YwgA/O-acetyl-ADP-ribose deacetylase (regulator of RNase III)
LVTVKIGDLFASNAQTLVNSVNCVGVMGKGVALEFRKRYPEMYEDYVARCARGLVRMGRPYLYRQLAGPWVLNFPTKQHWRSVSRVADIEQGLHYLAEHYTTWGITSLAVPPLGCGHGGLEWAIVGPTLYRALRPLGIPVEMYAPYATPEAQLSTEFLAVEPTEGTWVRARSRHSRLELGWIALVEILKRLEEQPYRWPTGRTMFQKLAYAATREGLPTGLRWQRGSFGPFAPELKHVLTVLANEGLVIEQSRGQTLEARVGPAYQTARRAFEAQLDDLAPTIEKVADLFARLSTKQSELVATVLFAATHLGESQGHRPTEREVVTGVLEWKQRRRPPLTEAEVAEAVRNLAALGWLDVEPSRDLRIPEDAGVEA